MAKYARFDPRNKKKDRLKRLSLDKPSKIHKLDKRRTELYDLH